MREREEDDGQQKPQCQVGAQVFLSGRLLHREAPVAYRVDDGGHDEDGPRHQRQQRYGQVKPERFGMVIQVAGEAFQVVLQKEDAEELRVRALYRDEPRRGNGEVERDPDRPQRAPQQAPVAAQSGECDDDDSRKKNSDRSFG